MPSPPRWFCALPPRRREDMRRLLQLCLHAAPRPDPSSPAASCLFSRRRSSRKPSLPCFTSTLTEEDEQRCCPARSARTHASRVDHCCGQRGRASPRPSCLCPPRPPHKMGSARKSRLHCECEDSFD